MEFSEYTEKAFAFANLQETKKLDLIHACLGITSDLGELDESTLVPGWNVDVNTPQRVNFIEELGDVFWFLNLLMKVTGGSLSEQVQKADATRDIFTAHSEKYLRLLNQSSARIADMVKAHVIYGKPLDAVMVNAEAGYIASDLQALAEQNGLTLDRIFDANIAKLTARYGDKYTLEKALNRDRAAEAEAIRKTQGS